METLPGDKNSWGWTQAQGTGQGQASQGVVSWHLGDESLGRVDNIIYMDHIFGLSLLSLTQV